MKPLGLKCRSMIWNPWVQGSQAGERLHELSMPSISSSSMDDRHALKLCEMSRVVLRVRMEVFFGSVVQRLSQCHIDHCGNFGFVVAGAAFCGEDVERASTLWSVYSRSARGVVKHFCSFALHVSSIKMHGSTWLQHTERSCIPYRSVAHV